MGSISADPGLKHGWEPRSDLAVLGCGKLSEGKLELRLTGHLENDLKWPTCSDVQFVAIACVR